jgi:hypothetical protein
MNTTGVFACIISAALAFILARYVFQCDRAVVTGVPIATGLIFGIVASLLTRRPDPEQVDRFFSKIYTPVGSEDQLGQSLDEAVPPSDRLITAGGLFIVKPARQSWVGFLAVLGACIACVLIMLALLKA